jgi:hypothetical protein
VDGIDTQYHFLSSTWDPPSTSLSYSDTGSRNRKKKYCRLDYPIHRRRGTKPFDRSIHLAPCFPSLSTPARGFATRKVRSRIFLVADSAFQTDRWPSCPSAASSVLVFDCCRKGRGGGNGGESQHPDQQLCANRHHRRRGSSLPPPTFLLPFRLITRELPNRDVCLSDVWRC